MDQTLKAKLDEAEESLLETFELALTYGDGASKNIPEFLETFEDILNVKNLAVCCEQALAKAEEQSTLDGLESVYASELNKKKNFNAKNTKDYKTFRTRLQQMKETFDRHGNIDPSGSSTSRFENDEMIVETQIQTTDPLTKRQMENPVKNTICGHNYEKTSILEAIRINHRLRCPVAGCGNKQLMQPNHLVDDDALKLHIMNMKIDDSDEDDPLGF